MGLHQGQAWIEVVDRGAAVEERRGVGVPVDVAHAGPVRGTVGKLHVLVAPAGADPLVAATQAFPCALAGSLGGVPAVTTTPQSGADGSDVTVLYLHGGAFVFCGPGTHARLCSSLAVHLDAPVHAVRYRKLPEVDLAALINEVYSAYRSLAGQLPAGHRIVVAGDSAGGFLAAKICELAALDDVRAPAAMVGYSPLFDLDREVRDGSWFTRDAYQPAATLQRAQALWSRGPAGIRGERSMLEVDPEAFPPTLITLAAGELVEDSAIALTERLHAAGRTVETHRWYTAVHAFPVLDGLAPESRRARELTVEFLRKTLPRVG